MTRTDIPVFGADGHMFEDDDEIFDYYEGAWIGQTRFRTFGLFPGARRLVAGHHAERG